MEGAKRKNPDRPVSLMSLSARKGVDQAERQGLCYKRFRADITLDCYQMPEKDSIIGNKKVQFKILPEGKTCWPECELFQQNLPCPLRDGVRYAAVEVSGKLHIGDNLKVMRKAKAD
jgi:hypothetical protein